MKEQIPILMTLQEYCLMGGSPPLGLTESREWYVPVGVLLGHVTLEEARVRRRELETIKSATLAGVLGFAGKNAIIELADLDEKTGRTCEDPKVLGIWNPEEETMEEIPPERNLTEETYELFRPTGEIDGEMDLHLRTPLVQGEQEGPSVSESKG